MRENNLRSPSLIYEIQISGRLSPEMADWLGCLAPTITQAPYGVTVTTLRVQLADQSALFGILARIRDLGLKLISVNLVEPQDEALGESK